jgi:hypothetical protein
MLFISHSHGVMYTVLEDYTSSCSKFSISGFHIEAFTITHQKRSSLDISSNFPLLFSYYTHKHPSIPIPEIPIPPGATNTSTTQHTNNDTIPQKHPNHLTSTTRLTPAQHLNTLSITAKHVQVLSHHVRAVPPHEGRRVRLSMHEQEVQRNRTKNVVKQKLDLQDVQGQERG